MRLIDADALALAPLALVEALRAGHRAAGMGAVERLLIADPTRPENAALTWAGWQEGRGLAVKTAAVFPQNPARNGRPAVQSVVVLFAPDDGRPLAAIHGESFTRMKTASDSALAADVLAVAKPQTLAVLGTGGQAETHIRFMLAVRPSIGRVVLWNRTAESAQRLATTIVVPGVVVEVAAEAQAAVQDADIVSCLTAATRPVLCGEWLRAGAHVDLVGGYTPTMRESDDAVVRRGRLFADSLRFGVETCGDYAIPLAAGVIAPGAIVGDLFGLCAGQVAGRRNANEITVCKNGGGGHLDLMAACAVYDAACRAELIPRP